MSAPTIETTENRNHRFGALALTDGTIHSNDAITQAIRLLPDDLAWHLATLIDPQPSFLIATAGATSIGGPVVAPSELERQVAERRAAGRAAVAETASVFEQAPIETVVLSGPGVAPVVDHVDERGLELIVSPSPVRHANATDRGGDLADDLVDSSPVPLLVVPAGDAETAGERAAARDRGDGIKLLIAVDDTRLDQLIVGVALDIFDRPTREAAASNGSARGRSAVHGVVVHIDPGSDAIMSVPFSSGVLGSGGAALAALAEQLDDEGRRATLTARRVAEEVAARLGDDRTIAIGDVGDPAEAILRVAGEHQADVIVVGTRNRSWFSRLFDPSVADAVTEHARRPVLVVRSDLDTTTHP